MHIKLTTKSTSTCLLRHLNICLLGLNFLLWNVFMSNPEKICIWVMRFPNSYLQTLESKISAVSDETLGSLLAQLTAHPTRLTQINWWLSSPKELKLSLNWAVPSCPPSWPYRPSSCSWDQLFSFWLWPLSLVHYVMLDLLWVGKGETQLLSYKKLVLWLLLSFHR